MALETLSPAPVTGAMATLSGSMTSQVRGAISCGACSDDHTCCA